MPTFSSRITVQAPADRLAFLRSPKVSLKYPATFDLLPLSLVRMLRSHLSRRRDRKSRAKWWSGRYRMQKASFARPVLSAPSTEFTQLSMATYAPFVSNRDSGETRRRDCPWTFKLLREQHPIFVSTDPHAEHILRALRGIATILDALSPLRNRGSMAHPNPALLGDNEAMLAINCGRTVLHYLDAKLRTREA